MEILNTPQQQAVESTEGYIRVIAGAGSGKTRALSHRFAYLVESLGILPENILCVTFTNKSAMEMRQRIRSLTGDQDTGYICTFHSLCHTILLEDSHAINYPKSFQVLDNTDINSFLDQIYEERNLSMRDMTYSSARYMFEIMKLIKIPDYYMDLISLSLEELRLKYETAAEISDILFYGYLYYQKKTFSLDYNDLIILTLYVFENNEDIRLKWQERLEYIMIDEFQDIDALQYRLMEVLSAFHKNLFIVGDPDQTIYTWRGANVNYLLQFDEHFSPCKTIFLNENYRSSPEILQASNQLISHNKKRIKKNLISHQNHELRPVVHYGKSAVEEGEWITQKVKDLIRQGFEYEDITILYRSHFVSRAIEDSFLKERIPYAIFSGMPFYARSEIKDAIAYLKMIVYQDDLSFLRTVNRPKRNIGKRRIEFLKKKAEEEELTLYQALLCYEEDSIFKSTKVQEYLNLIHKFMHLKGTKVSDLLGKILDESGYEAMLRTEGSQEKLDNLAELKQAVQEYEISCQEDLSLIDYLNQVAFFSNEEAGSTKGKVSMMTVHSAKGLEFRIVILAGLAEGIFPSRKISSLDEMEEERRLCFVAMTRAMKRLYLTGSYGKNFDGSSRYLSRFVLNIDPDSLSFDPKLDQAELQKARSYLDSKPYAFEKAEALKQYEIKDRILHPVFGEGTILDMDKDKGILIVHFDKLATERRLSIKAKLQIIGKNSFTGLN